MFILIICVVLLVIDLVELEAQLEAVLQRLLQHADGVKAPAPLALRGARVFLAHANVLPFDALPLDFAKGSGLAVHLLLGMGSLGLARGGAALVHACLASRTLANT